MITVSLAIMTALPAAAQQTLTLDRCREMAIDNNKELEQARTKVEMAGYDKKIARANYFPNISATGAYLYNEKNIALISDDASSTLTNLGTTVQGQLSSGVSSLMQAIQSNPSALVEYMGSPMWQTIVGSLSQADVSAALNQIGTEIDDALHLDINNVFAGVVSLQQPVFVGGKIVASNKIANLAEELSRTQYDQKYQEILITVDQAYWQVVSVANKKKLAEEYADLLHKMEKDVEVSLLAGVATKSDELSIKVKANEADMLLTKATNGLVLSKMLLCKEIGLDLNSDIMLADEGLEVMRVPQMLEAKDMEEIYASRPETRSLDLASQIYAKKVTVARADMLPQIALTANYLYTNPSSFNGFENKWGGMFSAGVMVKIPIFHGFEAMQKTRKAKAEATLYTSQYEDAKNLINLQVTQLRKEMDEGMEKLMMAENNLENAEENLRTASIGFEAGVVTANTALSAHTAWLQAHSEYIDAGVELQMTRANLQKAQGDLSIEQ